jgi:hypothetical protein
MPIVISDDLVLADPAPAESLATPIFGWETLITSGNVSATTAAAGFPASNLANPATTLRWQSEPASPADDQYITVALSGDDATDYMGVAIHNFGGAQIPVSVEGSTGGSPEWFELVQDTIQANDDPLLFRWTPQNLTGVRLRMQPGTAAPYAAVVYVGKLLVLERGTHTDHVPINLARNDDTMLGISESGNFLGTVTIRESRMSSFALQHLRPDWYRANMDPFIAQCRRNPFFFAWRPTAHPKDVGYVISTNNPQPQRSFNTERFAVELSMTGVAHV